MPEQFFVVEAVDNGPDDSAVKYKLLTFRHQNISGYGSISSCVSPTGSHPEGSPPSLLLETQFQKNSTARTRVSHISFQLHRQKNIKKVGCWLSSHPLSDHGPHLQTPNISPRILTRRNMGTHHHRALLYLSRH